MLQPGAQRAQQHYLHRDGHSKRPQPVLLWLGWLAIVGVLPAWVASVVTIAASYHRERAIVEREAIGTARAVIQTVDDVLAGTIAAMQVLGTSPYLNSGDIAAFQRQAREVVSTQPGNAIVLLDASGQQIMNTRRPYGEKLPLTGTPTPVSAVFKTAKPAISNFYVGAVSQQPQVAIGVPVIRDGKVVYGLLIGLPPERLNKVLQREHLPGTWRAWICDTAGTIIARTRASERLVGHKVSAALFDRLAQAVEGAVEIETRDGIPVLAAFSHSNRSGFAAAIDIPIAELTADLHVSMWWSIAEAGFVFPFAAFLAWYASLRIARSIQALSGPALALASDAPIDLPPIAVREVAEVGNVLLRAQRLIKERTVARDQVEAQARAHQAELTHVARVLLAGEMAAGIAHELIQPLTAIIAYGRGCLRLLSAAPAGSEMLKEGVLALVLQAERAEAVLIRLRDFVRQGASRRRFLAIEELIDASVTLIDAEAKLAKVELAVSIDPGLPPLYADDVEIEQVVLNLLFNAIDAMIDAGTDRRRIVITARRTENGRIEVSIADNGPGVGEAMQERIFEPCVTTKPRGVGMGLSISRMIVEAHGGRLRLIPSAGATFAFDLPTSAGADAHAG